MSRPLVMVSAMLLAILALPLVGSAQKIAYVTDVLHVTIRSGPSVSNKIIYRARTGDRFTVLDSDAEGWAKVRLPDGSEGWMISRYLQDEAPAALRLEALNPQNKSLLARVEELANANRTLKEELALARRQAKEASRAYDKLKADSAGVLKLKEDYSLLKDRFTAQKAQLDELTMEVESLRLGRNLKWFLAGAGVLVLGWMMGLALGRRKRRWSSKLY